MSSSRRNTLLLLIISHFSVDLYGSFLAPFQPFLTAKHHLTLARAGFLVSLLSISASLLQPLYGYWSDRLGRRFFVVLAPLLAGTFMSCLPIAPSYPVLMLFLALGGVGIASFHPQASSLSHSVGGSKKGLAMSLFISGGNFGTAIGPVCILYFVDRVGSDSAYLAAIPGVLLSIVLFFVCPDLERKTPFVSVSSVIRQVKAYAAPLGSLYTIVVFRTLVQLSFLTFIPILLRRMDSSPIFVGVALACFAGIGAIGGMTGGFLYDHIGGRNLFVFSSIAAPIFLFLTSQIQDPIARLLFLALGGFCLMMTIPISVLMGQSIVPGAISTVSSLMMGFGWGMGGMLVPLVGKLADLTAIPTALGFVASIPLLYLPLALKLPKTAPEKTVQPDISHPVVEN